MRNLIVIAALLVTATPCAAAAATVVTGANGYTLDDAGRLARFATLVVGDDGRVAATLGPRAPLPAGRRIDLHGRTLLPGLIDAHGHVFALGARALSVDLSDTTSLDAALARIAAFAAARPNARWIVGGGWNQERWGLGRFPTAAELDRAAGGRPAWLQRIDGHAGWANSAALAAAGVTAATKDPAGGRIERGPDGVPSGVLVDGAKALVDAHVPPPAAAEAAAALAEALRIMASVGLTGAADMGISPDEWALYRRFDAEHRLTARITAMAGGSAALAAIAPGGPIGWSGDERLSLPGVKLYGDGALGSRGAWLKADYSDAPGNRGLRFHPPEELDRLVGDATAKGFQVAVHAIGDATNAEVLDAFAQVPAATRAKLRLRIEHAQVVDPADLPRFAALGVIASMQPTHATSDKGMAEARLGDARLAGAYAWSTLIAGGARFAAGSDFPVESPNPFYGLHAAVTRQDAAGQPPGGWRPAERLSRIQAFAAFTTGAAYAAHAETRVGTLTPGKWADFIVVDRDPFTVAPDAIRTTKVEATWVGGQQVFGQAAAR